MLYENFRPFFPVLRCCASPAFNSVTTRRWHGHRVTVVDVLRSPTYAVDASGCLLPPASSLPFTLSPLVDAALQPSTTVAGVYQPSTSVADLPPAVADQPTAVDYRRRRSSFLNAATSLTSHTYSSSLRPLSSIHGPAFGQPLFDSGPGPFLLRRCSSSDDVRPFTYTACVPSVCRKH